MGTEPSDARVIVRRIVLPLVVGVCVGYGLSSLPTPANVISVLALALIGLAWSAWQLADVRRHARRMEELARQAQAYIDSYDRHPRHP